MPLPPKISDLTSALQLIPHPEGGFFVETYRSGCDPMSTKGQTGLDCKEPNINLVHANGRGNNRQDRDDRRNCLTSIYWVPTIASPKLLLAKNHSDHIHYYHGGSSFKYYIYNPDTGIMVEEILGPDIHKGHRLQVCVAGGLWKCGHLIEDKDGVNKEYEYTCIGEAVAPGFDFHDFTWITEGDVRSHCKDNKTHINILLEYIHENATAVIEAKETVKEAAEFYDENDEQKERAAQRLGNGCDEEEMATSFNINKRIRRSSTDSNNAQLLHLSNLPIALLPKVASFLSKTSCISFTRAMTQSSSLPSTLSKSIMTASQESWDTIDFKDVQDTYERSLTDNDIRWILLCVDGVNKIKSLKLHTSIGITGSGLQPLMGSIVLEWIDLSLVGDHENPTITPEPPISADIVVPVLNGIIEREDNSLSHIQLPKKWRIERSDTLTQFLQRFNMQLNERRYPCSRVSWGCDEICRRSDDQDEDPYELVYWNWQETDSVYHKLQYGIVTMTCFLCKKNICHICEDSDYEINFCKCCDKFYCQDCNNVNYCYGDNCTTQYLGVAYQPSSCRECNFVKTCFGCLEGRCPECELERTFTTCQYCDLSLCGDCSSIGMHVCGTSGCNRANCNGISTMASGHQYSDDNCTNQNVERQECVVVDLNEEVDDEPSRGFCRDCWARIDKEES